MTHVLDRFIRNTHIAYFTMEIALRGDMHTYSGGLGVLAGDTARSCADLAVPVVFVSLISHAGYIRQQIDDQGRQVDSPDPWNPTEWAKPLNAKIAIELEGRPVWIRPWLYELRCPLGHSVAVLLLDTDLEENSAEDRRITHFLYGGDEVYRLKQEAVLGIGGMRLLQALGFEIHDFHMNEGHAALLTIELLRRYPRPQNHMNTAGTAYDYDRVLDHCIFTTHTPVEAGHDRFAYTMIANVLGDFIETEELKLYAGKDNCNMTRLALNLSGFVNGVAARHAKTTEHMFPGYHVRAITNGVHVATWMHPSFARIFDTHFPQWSHEPEVLTRADQIDDAEIWQAHTEAKADLIKLIGEKTGVQFSADIPIIGFARRMTGYKRPELLLSDMERLRAIYRKHPFQVVWAGKAHPKDWDGKRLIEDINRDIKTLKGQIPMAFLENYDMDLARQLTAGVDVWLNTPLPPLEASGTSGMKAAMNGVLNFSVLDGWWIEAWIEDVTGWAIGTDGDSHHLPATERDRLHAEALYDKLERVVVPCYYDAPDCLASIRRDAIALNGSHFNTHRMVLEYLFEAYRLDESNEEVG